LVAVVTADDLPVRVSLENYPGLRTVARAHSRSIRAELNVVGGRYLRGALPRVERALSESRTPRRIPYLGGSGWQASLRSSTAPPRRRADA
jgi:hypothetical protein